MRADTLIYYNALRFTLNLKSTSTKGNDHLEIGDYIDHPLDF